MKNVHVGSGSASADDDDAPNAPWFYTHEGSSRPNRDNLVAMSLESPSAMRRSHSTSTVETWTIIGAVAGYAVAPSCQVV